MQYFKLRSDVLDCCCQPDDRITPFLVLTAEAKYSNGGGRNGRADDRSPDFNHDHQLAITV